ncbi:MAG: magnesium transporter [Thalassobaculaceae bacterium]
MSASPEQPAKVKKRAITFALYGLTPEVEKAVARALAEDRVKDLRKLIKPLHAADLADLLERQDRERRRQLAGLMSGEFDPEVLTYLDEAVREEVMEAIDDRDLATAIARLDSDDAVDLISEMGAAEQARVLEALPARDRLLVEEGLTFPEESAGRLMQREVVVTPAHWTVGQTIDFLRTASQVPDDFYAIFVVDPAHRPVGALYLDRLLRTKRPVRVADIMVQDFHRVPAEMDQEEVALLFRQYGLVAAPVTDGEGRLLGVVTIDDVVTVIDAEAEEDLMRLGGVSEIDLYGNFMSVVRGRFAWLVVNLVTAVLASMVIGAFQGAIEKLVALAVLMPIVASMGGNAGTQTVTVAVRALAMRELTAINAMRFVMRETLVGSFNAVAFAVVAGAVSWFWFDDLLVAGIMASAMAVNLVVAGLFGTIIPLTLDRLGVDPAVASSVFMTTVTDVVGFLSFLGLAALWLL